MRLLLKQSEEYLTVKPALIKLRSSMSTQDEILYKWRHDYFKYLHEIILHIFRISFQQD